jgi:hypothetical protein
MEATQKEEMKAEAAKTAASFKQKWAALPERARYVLGTTFVIIFILMVESGGAILHPAVLLTLVVVGMIAGLLLHIGKVVFFGRSA